MQQKEPPKDLLKASIQTPIKTNLPENFGSNTKNEAIEEL
jgi:hypothetical protein